jgi:hypothetical protein
VSPRAVQAAERSARELAHECGGAILEVRMGERSDVEVRRPDTPLGEELTASLRQP